MLPMEDIFRAKDIDFKNEWKIYSMPTSTKEKIGYTVPLSRKKQFLLKIVTRDKEGHL